MVTVLMFIYCIMNGHHAKHFEKAAVDLIVDGGPVL